MTYKMLGKSNGLVNGYREKKKKIAWSGLSNLGFFFFFCGIFLHCGCFRLTVLNRSPQAHCICYWVPQPSKTCWSAGPHNFSLLCKSIQHFLMRFFAAILDIIICWKARQSMSFHVQLRYILKAASAATWVIILPITYAYTWENPSGLAKTIKSWIGNWQSFPSLYILAVVIYLSPNMLATLLFLFPFLRRFLERSNYRIIALMMWWSQVC